jgi:hypothetical protein
MQISPVGGSIVARKQRLIFCSMMTSLDIGCSPGARLGWADMQIGPVGGSIVARKQRLIFCSLMTSLVDGRSPGARLI